MLLLLKFLLAVIIIGLIILALCGLVHLCYLANKYFEES